MILLWSFSFVTFMWTGGVWALEGIRQVYELSAAIFVDWFPWRLVSFLRLDIVGSDQFSPVSAHNCVAITFSLWLFLWHIIIYVCNFCAGLLRFLVRTAIIVVNPCSIFFSLCSLSSKILLSLCSRLAQTGFFQSSFARLVFFPSAPAPSRRVISLFTDHGKLASP
jgi:hypothetical protein